MLLCDQNVKSKSKQNQNANLTIRPKPHIPQFKHPKSYKISKFSYESNSSKFIVRRRRTYTGKIKMKQREAAKDQNSQTASWREAYWS